MQFSKDQHLNRARSLRRLAAKIKDEKHRKELLDLADKRLGLARLAEKADLNPHQKRPM